MKQVYSCINDRTKMSDDKPDCNNSCSWKMSDNKCGFIVDEEVVLKERALKESTKKV